MYHVVAGYYIEYLYVSRYILFVTFMDMYGVHPDLLHLHMHLAQDGQYISDLYVRINASVYIYIYVYMYIYAHIHVPRVDPYTLFV